MFSKSTFLKGAAGAAATVLCPGGTASGSGTATVCGTSSGSSSSIAEKHRFRKMGTLLPSPVKLFSKRRCYLCLKIAILVVVFGLYFMLLLRESMSALTGSSSSSSGSSSPFASMASFAALTSRGAKKAGGAGSSGKLDAWQDKRHHHGGGRAKQQGGSGLKGPPPGGGSKQRHQFPPLQQHSPAADGNGGAGSNHSTLNPVYEYSDEMNAAAETDFNERRMVLWNVCAEHRIVGKYPPNAWEFFISPGHGIAWCNIFKAASSTWMYYFNILGGYSVQYLQRTKASPIDLARKRFPRPTANELNDYISNTISFLIVREPFERLLSAYRNKLEGCRNKYYKLLGEQIVKKFRKAHPPKGVKPPHGPTFREFLEFLVSHYRSGGRFDEHWSPVYSFCTPCSINFTLIAKMETFQRDSEYIIRQAGLETLLLNKMPRYKARWITNRSTSDTRNLIPRYFAQIDEKLLTDVLEIYQLDFELFGYNSTKYYGYVQSPDYG
ncbi:carbohydrate sulfotransferase 11-like [Anopheles arabiensis]|uniref:Carbohydrate sulfotransferase n=1 Tax=Anopheles arabiensis TaxID=7173 RepID=A0A182I508_ANOAR|nr:carbohydrate sulfotransferase 11-like [Anopheles arabiensis]XP_040170685.1 carbohydrate sulfotransferase 11-like [Anopheles arabiensis]XP_040170686.1 carbohydrate sulfotransferase 11-like [Anopheles arabiensis]XP_040170687.1 carbohydrate sulfotransferase 11-like [Anopheles arabiensis]XP_040170688.1 carbohydrate sulfotransferase 11-like [Anopheles arabiensis]